MVERRHETTVDGIDAWAGEWKPQEDGSVLCWIFRENPSAFHQPAYVTYWPPTDERQRMVRLRSLHMTMAENAVSIELLKEARHLADGGDAAPSGESADSEPGEEQ